MKKGVFSKRIVTLIVIMNILFSAAVLWAFVKTSQEPVVLIGAWFGFTTGELWMVAKIKRDKIKESKENVTDEEDRLESEADEPEVLGADSDSGDEHFGPIRRTD